MEINLTCPRPKAHARLGMTKFITLCHQHNFTDILDVGCGEEQYHTIDMRNHGLHVDTVDFFDSATYRGEYVSLPPLDRQYEGLWCAATLEHTINPGLFLKRIFDDVKEGGLVAITVPPLKHDIVGGHVSLWNAGILLYQMIHAGFDCSDAQVATYDCNISVVVQKKSFTMPLLNYDTGDIEILSQYFPTELNAKQNFNGDIKRCNWD